MCSGPKVPEPLAPRQLARAPDAPPNPMSRQRRRAGLAGAILAPVGMGDATTVQKTILGG